jgi:uncharacterized protein (TIGR02145 family)
MGKILRKSCHVDSVMRKLGIFAGSFMITAFAVYFYSPVFKTHAEDDGPVTVTTDVLPYAGVTLSTYDITMNLTPTAEGNFESDSVIATASTNSSGGFEMYFSSEDNYTDMKNTDLSINDVIASDFDSTVTSATMAANKWGYSTDGTNFSKIPTSANHAILKNIDHFPSTAEKTATVYLGAKVDMSIAPGAYKKTVMFTVIAHEMQDMRTIFDIAKMQEMTPKICSNTQKPNKSATNFDWDGSKNGNESYVPRTVLEDERDGTRYLISKLADGNCWMSQNLYLILYANEPVITSTNTGGTSTFTPTNTTQTNNSVRWTDTENVARSYESTGSYSYYRNGQTRNSSPTASGDAYLWETAGVQYNWYAATGGTGTSSVTSGEASVSICPKGWRLPASGNVKSFTGLATAYGSNNSNVPAASSMRTSPLNFTLAGYYRNNSTQAPSSRGSSGRYWTSYTAQASRASYMSFSTTAVYPLQSGNRGIGYNIRCVAI